jgi:hypothetical protein
LPVLAAAVALVAGGGTALAGDGTGASAGTRCDRIWAKLAEKRGVSVEQLKAQWRAKLIARVDAAVKAGRLTDARAAELKAGIAKSTGCLTGVKRANSAPKHTTKFHAGALLPSAVADYLGLSKEAIATELRKGSSLAAIATKQGKSVDGLKALFLKPLKTRLDEAVAKGRLKADWRDAALARFEKFVDTLVQRSFTFRFKPRGTS